MSYTIEYRQRAFLIKPEQFADIVCNDVYGPTVPHITKNGDPLYLLLTESGSNNTYDMHTNKRSRSVQLGLSGTHYSVIRSAILAAEYVHSGLLHVHGKRFSNPEGYVGHIRRILAEAAPIEVLAGCVNYLGFLETNLEKTALPRHPVFQQMVEAGDVAPGPKFYDLETKILKLGGGVTKIARLALLAAYAQNEYGCCVATNGYWVPGFRSLDLALDSAVGEQTTLSL